MLGRFVSALLALSSSLATAQSSQLVVSTEWLAGRLKDPSIVLLHVGSRDSAYRSEHIPGARFLPYRSLVQDVNGGSHELPAADSLRSLFEALGVSDASHVVLTGQPLEVSRAFYTLEYMGHGRVSALDGGLTKWKAEGRPTESAFAPVTRGKLTAHPPNASIVATTEWVQSRVGKPGLAFFDTRTEEEYLGAGRGGGHIDGARRVEWRSYFTTPTEFSLVDRTQLMRLFAERGASPVDTVVAYCAVGYRASGTYLIARILGVPVKLYDGSYDAWSKSGLPLTKTPTPLRQLPAPRNTGGGLPSVSRDGRHIAYVAMRDGKQSDSYVIDVASGHEVRLTNSPEFDGPPVWLRDRVLVWWGRDTATVTTLKRDGNDARVLLRTPGREFRPAPNGQDLLYATGPFQESRLVVSKTDGSNARTISQGMPPKFNAEWSPDGKRIAFTTMDSTRQLQVGIMNADGGNVRVLTKFTSTDGSPQWPSWSPDGSRLAIQVGKYDRQN
ncbi:MAG: rhodanese-like domain-containing protein, partial [Gemmatimonadota bacterium]